MATILDLLNAPIPCPGDHRTDGQAGTREDLWRDVMDEHEIPDDIETSNDLYRADIERWRALLKVVESRWVKRGDCRETITVHLESDGDGEWRSWSYPVADDSPCVEALQLNECYEDGFRGKFWAIYGERARLREAITGMTDEEREYHELGLLACQHCGRLMTCLACLEVEPA